MHSLALNIAGSGRDPRAGPQTYFPTFLAMLVPPHQAEDRFPAVEDWTLLIGLSSAFEGTLLSLYGVISVDRYLHVHRL